MLGGRGGNRKHLSLLERANYVQIHDFPRPIVPALEFPVVSGVLRDFDATVSRQHFESF